MVVSQPRKVFLEDIEIDVTENENLSFDNEITSRPVERQADVVDHIRPMPDIVNFSGVIVGEHADEKYQRLKKYRDTGQLLTYIGHLQIMENMAIESLSPSRTAQIANGFAFEIVLKQIRFVEIETIDYIAPEPEEPVAVKQMDAQVQNVKDQGRQQPEEEEINEEHRQGIIERTLRALGWGGDEN